jgi:hypothetical protein
MQHSRLSVSWTKSFAMSELKYLNKLRGVALELPTSAKPHDAAAPPADAGGYCLPQAQSTFASASRLQAAAQRLI